MKCASKRNRLIALAAGTCSLAALMVGAVAETSVIQWDQFSSTGATAAGPAMEALIKVCEADLKDTKIDRTVAPSIGIRDTYRLAVSADKTPDLAYTWPAASVLAGYARTGKVAALNPYYEKYGWENVNPFYRGRNSYQGKIYAVPMEQDLMGVYYNRDLFKKLGLEVPKTYAEFKAVVEKLKEAGAVPIAFGNKDRWPATNTMSLIMGLSTGRANEEKVFFGDEPWPYPAAPPPGSTVPGRQAGDLWFAAGAYGSGHRPAGSRFFAGRLGRRTDRIGNADRNGNRRKFDHGCNSRQSQPQARRYHAAIDRQVQDSPLRPGDRS
jgi:raffinose/stachyose/melibiose transport system substrate-binding protein